MLLQQKRRSWPNRIQRRHWPYAACKLTMNILTTPLAILIIGTASAQDCISRNILFIGNSYTGGTGVGRVCDEQGASRPNCEDYAIPGNVTAAFNAGNYDGTFTTCCDYAPIGDLLVGDGTPYNAYTNPHRGDVPGKVKKIADEICGGAGSIGYAQNSQSSFFTTTHAGQSSNEQSGTINLLNDYPHDVIIVQPQSTEYLIDPPSGDDFNKRVDALNALLSSTSTNFVQQTWARRKVGDTNGAQHKCEFVDVIDGTLSALATNVNQGLSFSVIPTGLAWLKFAQLACPTIFDANNCTLDETVTCPIFFGESGKISLYHEAATDTGTHQSEEVGAWLSAAVIYGAVQSPGACYVSQSVLESVMPTVSNLAAIPSSMSIEELVRGSKFGLKRNIWE